MEWQRAGTNLPGATQSSLVLTNLTADDSGAYTLLASNFVNVSTSAVAQLTVYQNATVLQPLTHQVVDVGNTVTLAVNVAGTPPLVYSWQLNGVPIAGSDSTLTVSNISISQSDFYRVFATNQYGSVSSTGRVSVLATPSTIVAGAMIPVARPMSPLTSSMLLRSRGVIITASRFDGTEL